MLSSRIRVSFRVFALLILCLVLVRVVIVTVPDAFRSTTQAGVFAWPMIGVLTVIGTLGVWLSDWVGIPGLWDDRVALRDRLWLPLLVGAGFGVLAIVVDWTTGWAAQTAAYLKLPSIHIPFPQSLLIYPVGAIIVDIIYYLLFIPLLVWLISNVLLKGHGQNIVFWCVGVVGRYSSQSPRI